jgi:hypothetical protein
VVYLDLERADPVRTPHRILFPDVSGWRNRTRRGGLSGTELDIAA